MQGQNGFHKNFQNILWNLREPASNPQEVISKVLRFLKRISGKGRERLTEAELLRSYYQGGDLHVLGRVVPTAHGTDFFDLL